MSAVGAKPVYAIFLDIDGVLNDSLPTRDQEEQAKRELFPESLDLTRNQKKMIHARFLEKAAVDRFQIGDSRRNNRPEIAPRIYC